MASSASGTRTDEASTKTIDAPSPLSLPATVPPVVSPPPKPLPAPLRSAVSTRASRTAPRNTLSNAVRQASSSVVAIVPGGDPPTLISAPSKRPNRSRAAAISRAGVSGSALSATAQATRLPAESSPVGA